MKIFKFLILSVILTSGLFTSNKANAHCEIPCGIYEDSLRISLIMEHITTIEKSMKMINEISSSTNPDYNQLVRWVNNKEEHAKYIQEIVSQYFLHQRIKITEPSDKENYDRYIKQLTLLHRILVYAMKAKQTTDLEYITKLRKATQEFSDLYFHGHSH